MRSLITLMLCVVASSSVASEPYGLVLQRHIKTHQFYPESAKKYGITGEAEIRVRVDRFGNLLRYEFEKEPGHKVLDHALHQMMKRAHPMPVPPLSVFSGGDIAEFIIPVYFEPAPEK